MDHQIWWGIGSMLLGFVFLWYTIKFPILGFDITNAQFKGYSGGIGFIIIGIVMICDSLKIKFVRNAWLWIILFFVSSINRYDNNVEKMSSEQKNGFFGTLILFLLGLFTLISHLGSQHSD